MKQYQVVLESAVVALNDFQVIYIAQWVCRAMYACMYADTNAYNKCRLYILPFSTLSSCLHSDTEAEFESIYLTQSPHKLIRKN